MRKDKSAVLVEDQSEVEKLDGAGPLVGPLRPDQVPAARLKLARAMGLQPVCDCLPSFWRKPRRHRQDRPQRRHDDSGHEQHNYDFFNRNTQNNIPYR